jgi:hypothetical protein
MEIGARRAASAAGPSISFQNRPKGARITTNPSASPLVAALKDSTRTRIGNPWRGTYHLSIATADAHEATALANQLDSLGITFQVNYQRDGTGRPKRGFLAIYDLDSLQRLSKALGSGLDEERRSALETLVRARGPIPPEILRRIGATVNMGESYAYVAERMNQLRIVDGMRGKGWTTTKIRDAYDVYEEHLRDQQASRVEPATAV